MIENFYKEVESYGKDGGRLVGTIGGFKRNDFRS